MDKSSPRFFQSVGILYLSIVLAAVTRIYKLGSQSIWGDESLTLLWYTAGKTFAEAWHNIWQAAAHPPLYFIIAYYWFKLGKSEFMLRFPSALFGIASIPVLYLLAKRLFGRKTAGIAAFIAVLSPVHIWYSQEARMYSLQILLSLASMLFFVKVWQEKRARDVALYMLFTVAALFTHVNTVFLLAAQGVFSVGASIRNTRRMLMWIGIQAAALLIFSPWLLNLVYDTVSSGNGVHVGYERAASFLDAGYGLYTFSVGYSMGPSVIELHQGSVRHALMGHLATIIFPGIIFAALIVLGLIRSRQTGKWNFWFLLTGLIIPPALAAAMSIYPGIPMNPRYMIVAIISYWLTLALGIQLSFRMRMLRLLPVAVLAIYSGSLFNYYFNPSYAKQDIRSAVAVINKQARPGDVVIISSIELGGPFIYYFKHKDVPYFGYPPSVGFVDQKSLPKDMNKLLRNKKRAWLILGRTWSSDPQGLIAAYLNSQFNFVENRSYSGIELRCFNLNHRRRSTGVLE